MWIIFLICAIFAALLLVIQVNLTLNTISKKIDDLTGAVKKHYGLE
jgi:hypothetical protein